MTEFKATLEQIQKEFELEEFRTKEEFNIFNALYKKDSEKLHSRFISYLLSPTSKHKMGSKFLEAFFEVLSENENRDLLNKIDLSKCVVRPNEEEKKEHEKIDILISNDNQAIVIENKIFAIDSYHNEGEKHQLDTYCDVMLKEGKTYIIAIYLALNTRDPKGIEIAYKPLIKIDYQRHILKWIRKCIEITDNSFILKNILLQYESIIIGLTSNVKRATDLKNLINNNIEKAWNEKNYICEKMGDFKHAKWLTINDFWLELAQALSNKLKIDICKKSNIEEITKVAHDKKGSTGINFKLENGKEWYIRNDNKNGLSYGKILEDMSIKRDEDEDWFKIPNNFKFTKFNDQETFKLINTVNREKKINEIIEEIKANVFKESKSIIL